MGEQVHFNTSAQLFENDSGVLAIRLANNSVFEYVGLNVGKSFVLDAMALMSQGNPPADWRRIPYRKLAHDDQNWRLVSSMGFLDGDEAKPALLLEVNPEALGSQAKQYLQADLPKTLQ